MKTLKARVAWVLIVTIIGLAAGAGTTAWAFYNWDSSYDEDFNFPANTTSVTKNWVGLNGKSEIQSVQEKGNSDCKYTLKVRTRTNSTYKTIYSNLSYKENDTPSSISTYTFGNWVDYKFQMKKTTEAGTTSRVRLMVEINE